MNRPAPFLLLGVLVAGCGSDDSGTPASASPDSCEPGAVQECTCSDGPTSLMVCNPETKEWFECDCPGGPVNSVPAVIGALEWETTPAANAKWSDASAACAAKGWRLPTRAECESLFSSCTLGYDGSFSSCTCTTGNGCKQMPKGMFWAQDKNYAKSTPTVPQRWMLYDTWSFLQGMPESYAISYLCVH